MTLEVAGGRKFTQFVANHVFCHVDGQKAFAVVDEKVQADEIRRDGGSTRPSLDRRAIIHGLRGSNPIHQSRVDEETFFQ